MVAARPIQPSRISALRNFYRAQGRMPSFAELGRLVGLRSKHAVWKLVKKLEAAGVVARDSTGRLIPGDRMAALKVLGTVEAGFPSPAEEMSLGTLSLDAWLIRDRDESFLLKVSGDSMIEAGILEGDLVIVDRNRRPKSGDIVVAEVDGAWTMKRLERQGERVVLIPANARYRPILPVNELRIAGVVTAVIRSYGS
ncbi:MAG: transcriptional repressor LexA [Nitrospirota bacterium]